MTPKYSVKALWDEEAGVWYSESNIPGLVIEADSLAQFEQLLYKLGPEMLAENENIHNVRIPVEFEAIGVRQLEVA
jgi:hypothetical protein